ncbi:MAG: hypothetical protein KQJ78_24980, partial [Deltaproteobacteria bacterium]|nr:hypothetical protein [Deltaproteobacteria bacterium]
MKSVLVASADRSAQESIRKCFGADHRVVVVEDPATLVENFAAHRHEFTFVEISFLANGQAGSGSEQAGSGGQLNPTRNASGGTPPGAVRLSDKPSSGVGEVGSVAEPDPTRYASGGTPPGAVRLSDKPSS